MDDTNKKLRCPFRTECGEFAECYGKACMAYFEFDSAPPPGFSCTQSAVHAPVVTPMCRRLAMPVPYGAGCSI